MDQTKAKKLLQIVFDKFKKQGIELQAYRITFVTLKEALKHDHPDFVALADDSLAAARISPVLHKTMRQQYDEPLERLLERVSQAETEEEVERLLLAMSQASL